MTQLLLHTDSTPMASPPLTASSVAHRARVLVSLVNDLAQQTNDSAGPRPYVLLAKLTPDGSYGRTLAGSLALNRVGLPLPYSGRWPKWGIASGGDIGALPMLELRINGKEFSSSEGWPTPRAYSHGDDTSAPGLTALDVVARGLYPDNERYWQTPAADSFRPCGGDRKDEMGLDQQARMQWPSPRATDGTKGGPNQHGSKGDLMLSSAVTQWPTPQAHDAHTGNPARVGRNNGGGNRNLNDEVVSGAGQLNPSWVSLLMGLPAEWTNPDVPNDALALWPGWPARPGAAQYPYEPPRTVHKIPNRAKRLRALGNAVCVLQALPLFEAIMAIEEAVR